MGARKVLPFLSVLLIGAAIYFFVIGNVALGAAMIAIAFSQFAVFAALSAKANDDPKGQD